MEKFLTTDYWESKLTRHDIKLSVEEFCYHIKDYHRSDREQIINELLVLTFFIRDKYIGLGNKDISRWMFLELELAYPGFLSKVLKSIPDFGYYKDYNLILIDIVNDKKFKHIEDNIYNIILEQFKLDLLNYEKTNYDSISLLVKYIGKERRCLDKKTGFSSKLASLLYPNLTFTQKLRKYRADCSKLSSIKNIKNNKNKINMPKKIKDKDAKKINFHTLKQNMASYPRYLNLNTNLPMPFSFSNKKSLSGNYIISEDNIPLKVPFSQILVNDLEEQIDTIDKNELSDIWENYHSNNNLVNVYEDIDNHKLFKRQKKIKNRKKKKNKDNRDNKSIANIDPKNKENVIIQLNKEEKLNKMANEYSKYQKLKSLTDNAKSFSNIKKFSIIKDKFYKNNTAVLTASSKIKDLRINTELANELANKNNNSIKLDRARKTQPKIISDIDERNSNIREIKDSINKAINTLEKKNILSKLNLPNESEKGVTEIVDKVEKIDEVKKVDKDEKVDEVENIDEVDKENKIEKVDEDSNSWTSYLYSFWSTPNKIEEELKQPNQQLDKTNSEFVMVNIEDIF